MSDTQRDRLFAVPWPLRLDLPSGRSLDVDLLNLQDKADVLDWLNGETSPEQLLRRVLARQIASSIAIEDLTLEDLSATTRLLVEVNYFAFYANVPDLIVESDRRAGHPGCFAQWCVTAGRRTSVDGRHECLDRRDA